MADVGIKVTPEQLTGLSQRVYASSQGIANELGVLQRVLTPLHQDWVGAAHGRFDGLWNEWDASARSLKDALEGIGRLLAQAGHAYADAESQIASSFRAM